MVVVEDSQVEHVGIAGVHRDGAQPLGKRSLEHPAGVVRSSETKAAHDQIPRVALPGANVVRTSEVVDGSNGRKVAFVQLAPPVTLPIRVEGWNRGVVFSLRSRLGLSRCASDSANARRPRKEGTTTPTRRAAGLMCP